MDKLTDYVRHHHERYDGKGYPDGLKGKEISLGARYCVLQTLLMPWCPTARTVKACQRKMLFKELEKNAGTQFDPEIVEIS